MEFKYQCQSLHTLGCSHHLRTHHPVQGNFKGKNLFHKSRIVDGAIKFIPSLKDHFSFLNLVLCSPTSIKLQNIAFPGQEFVQVEVKHQIIDDRESKMIVTKICNCLDNPVPTWSNIPTQDWKRKQKLDVRIIILWPNGDSLKNGWG